MSDNNSKLPNGMQSLQLSSPALSGSRIAMMANHVSRPSLEDTEYFSRKQAMVGVSKLNPYEDMTHSTLTSTMRNLTSRPNDLSGILGTKRGWSNIASVITYCGMSSVEFAMSNVPSRPEPFEFNVISMESMFGEINLGDLDKRLETQIRSVVLSDLTNNGKSLLTAHVKSDGLNSITVEYSLDGSETESITMPVFASNPIKHLGESEMRQVNPIFDGDALSHLQLGQTLFPIGSISDIDSNIFVDRTKSSMAATDLFILDEVTTAHRTITRDELTDIKIKHKWFKGLPPVVQQMYKVAMLSNNAHTYRAVDCDVPEQWQKLSFNQTFGLVPRYGNSVIQPCNLVFKTDSKLLGIYSIFSSKTTVEGVCNAMYLRDWSEGLSSKRYYRCEDGDKFAVVDLADNSVRRLEPETPEYVLVEAKFRVYGNIFAYRLEQYVNKVKDSIPVSITHGKEQILEEALAWYLEDITVPDSLIQDEKYLITCTEALPTLRRYRGELSKPTGRKMPAHDRSAHTNRRYNPDGSVRMEWEVPVVEVNGGAKERFGIQISNIVPHLIEK